MSESATSYGSIDLPTAVQRHGEKKSFVCCCSKLNLGKNNVSVLVAAFLASLATGGPTYAFGLYGSTLKTKLHLSQSELDTISSANFCAGLLSWIPGMCVDKWGPKAAMATGGILECISLTAYWIAATQFDETTRHNLVVPVLSLLGVFIFMSNSLVIGGLFKVLVVSCGPGSKGSAVGAAKGYLGLGAGTYSCLFDAIKRAGESDLDFLPMAAFFGLLAIAMPAMLLVPNKENVMEGVEDVSTPMHYRTVYSGLLLLALLVVGTSASFLFLPLSDNINEIDSTAEDEGRDYLKAFLILLAWLGPILLLFCLPQTSNTIPVDKDDSKEWMSVDCEKQSQPSRPLISRTSSVDANGVNFTLMEMLKTVEAWLLLWSCTILVGSGTIMTNNMGQMVEALGFPSRAASGCLALFSVAQAMARVAAGSISEPALTWKTPCARPVFLVISSMFGILAHTILAVGTSRKAFVTGVVLSGTAFGMVWPLMVLIIGEVFGTTNHGANYMFYDGFTSAIGTLLISKYIAQSVYEDHIDPEDAYMDDITCYGNACFQLSHVITAALCFTSLISSVGVMYMTRSAYGQDSTTQHANDVLYGSPYMSRAKRSRRLVQT